MADLTIVIPSFNRPCFVVRNCRFLAGSGFKVLVLDGSAADIGSYFIGMNHVRYIHAPFSLTERLKMAASLVDTPYVAMLGDDDFFSISAVNQFCGFLDSNPEFVSCGGKSVGFYPRFGQLWGLDQYSRGRDFSLDFEDPLSRVILHFGAAYFPAHIYSVVRRDVWCNAVRIACDSPVQVLGILEFLVELVIVASGKSKLFNRLYWYRSHHENIQIVGTESCLNPESSLVEWWSSSKSSRQRSDFFNYLLTNLSNMNSGVLIAVGLTGYSVFIKSKKIHAWHNAVKSDFRWGSRLVRILSFFKRFTKRFMWSHRSLDDQLNKLSAHGVDIDFGEVNVIRALVLRQTDES